MAKNRESQPIAPGRRSAAAKSNEKPIGDFCEQQRQVALQFYQSARDEMFIRIRERELALYVWLGALGTIITITFRNIGTPNYNVLLVLPTLALGIALRINQHEMLIAALASYCRNEVGPIAKRGLDPSLCHWDECDSLRKRQERVIILRNIVTFALLVCPSTMALLFNIDVFASKSSLLLAAWICGLLFTIAVAILEVQSLMIRINALMVPDS